MGNKIVFQQLKGKIKHITMKGTSNKYDIKHIS